MAAVRRALDRAEYLAFLAGVEVVRQLPETSLPWIARALGALYRRLAPDRAAIARRNIRQALGDRLDTAAQARLACASIDQFFLTGLEFVRLPAYAERLDAIMADDGIEPLREALARGHGVLLLVAHYGLWDLGGAWLARHYGLPVHAVARKMDNPHLDRYVMAVRECLGIRSIAQRTAMREMLRLLRSNQIVCVLADQHSSRSAVLAPFFGRPAATVPSVARLALETGAAILPGCVVRQGPMRHRGRFYPPVEVEPTGRRDDDVLALTAAVNAAYERMILDQPDHWMWMHRRWKAAESPEGG